MRQPNLEETISTAVVVRQVPGFATFEAMVRILRVVRVFRIFRLGKRLKNEVLSRLLTLVFTLVAVIVTAAGVFYEIETRFGVRGTSTLSAWSVGNAGVLELACNNSNMHFTSVTGQQRDPLARLANSAAAAGASCSSNQCQCMISTA
jgi:hypothetical protein